MYEQLSAKKFFIGKLKEKAVDFGLVKNRKIFLTKKAILLKNIGSNEVLKQVYAYGWMGYEPELSRFICHYNYKIDAFVDGGANVGYYSVLFSETHPNVETLAIEALDRNVEYMENLKQDNDCAITIIHKAIDNQDDNIVQLFIPKNIGKSSLSTIGSIVQDFRTKSELYRHIDYEVKEVETVTLVTLLDAKQTALVKLDIEGNELNVLQYSLSRITDKDIDFILEIMINDDDKGALFELMSHFGYSGYLITNASLVREDRALTLPYPYRHDRTLWKNHYFTKKSTEEIEKLSKEIYGYFL